VRNHLSFGIDSWRYQFHVKESKSLDFGLYFVCGGKSPLLAVVGVKQWWARSRKKGIDSNYTDALYPEKSTYVVFMSLKILLKNCDFANF
jgi:hypothetical protein